MATTTLKQKIFLIVFSLFLTILCLELTLRLAGILELSIKNHYNQIKGQEQKSYRILCLGESTTFMGDEDAYPSQLEKILNQNSPKKFKVINKGIPAVNTNTIAARIDDF